MIERICRWLLWTVGLLALAYAVTACSLWTAYALGYYG